MKHKKQKLVFLMGLLGGLSFLLWSFIKDDPSTSARMQKVETSAEIRSDLDKKYRKFSVGEVNVEQLTTKALALQDGRKLSISLTLPDGISYNMQIEKNDMRYSPYKGYKNNTTVTTFKGKVKGKENSEVRLSLYKNYIYGFIMQDGKEMWIEPLKNPMTHKEIDGQFLVYNAKDCIEKRNTCPVVSEIHKTNESTQNKMTIPFNPIRLLRIVYDCDVEFVQAHGSLSGFYASGMFNNSAPFFESQFGLRLEVVEGNLGVAEYFTDDAGAILGAIPGYFAAYYVGWDKDIFVQLTERNIWGRDQNNNIIDIIGIANIRVLCSNPVVANTVVEDTDGGNLTRNTIIHEIGHVIGSDHTSFGFMTTSISGNETSFNQESVDQISAHLNANNACLAEVPSGCSPTPTCRTQYYSPEYKELIKEVVAFYHQNLNGNVKDAVTLYIKFEPYFKAYLDASNTSKAKIQSKELLTTQALAPKALAEFVYHEDKIISEADYQNINNLLTEIYNETDVVAIKKEIEKAKVLLPIIKGKSLKSALLAYDKARITKPTTSSTRCSILDNGHSQPQLVIENLQTIDDCSFEVWNMKGQLINTKILGTLSEGIQTTSLADLVSANGTYVVQIRFLEENELKTVPLKFILTK